jgi:hypothetical protein
VFHPGVGGQPLFQFPHFGPQDILPVGQDGLDVLQDPGIDFFLLGLEVNKGQRFLELGLP